MKPLHEEQIKIIKEWYEPNSRIIDLGCKDGRILRKLKGIRYGIDINQNYLRTCKKFGIKVLKHDLNKKIPLPSGHFDYTIATEILEHVPNTVSFIKEINRILKKHGKLFISVPYHGFIKNILISLFYFEKHFDYEHEHVRFFTGNSLKKLLKDNGFKILKIYKFGRFFPVYRLMMIVSEKK